MGGVNPDVTMENWMRSTQKAVDIEKRRPNFGWRVAGLEQRGEDNRIHNGDFRINQVGYASGGNLVPGMATGLGHDRWRASGRANLCRNPTGGTNTSNWSGSNVTVSRLTGLTITDLPGVTTAIRGTLTVATTGGLYYQGDSAATYPLAVIPGITYRITAWLRANVNKTIQPSIQFTNPANGGASSVTPTGTTALVANTWTKISYLYTVPVVANTTNPPAFMGPYWYSTAAWAIGNTLDIAGVMITETSTSADPTYFDGASSGCTWVGTAHASVSVDRSALTSYTFTQTPNGCTITLSSAGELYQVIERQDMMAGTYIFEHDGTALMRVYNRLAVPGVFAEGPIITDIDGLDDVIVEFQGTGGTKTISHVRCWQGAMPFPYRQRSYQQELRLCHRFRFRSVAHSTTAGGPILSGYGTMQATTVSIVDTHAPVPMRARALLSWSNLLYLTNRVNFNSIVSSLNYAASTEVLPAERDIAIFEVIVNHAAAGAATQPCTIVGQSGGAWIDYNSEFAQL